MKKILIYVFVVATSLVVGTYDVKAISCSTDNPCTVQRTGTAGGGYAEYTPGQLSTWDSNYNGYRITFVNKDGNKKANTKSVDYYFNSSNYFGGTYYNSYKYSNISNFSTQNSNYKGSITKEQNVAGCYSDSDCMNYIYEELNKKASGGTSTFADSLLSSTGLKTIPANKPSDGIFVVIEKLYTINFKTVATEEEITLSEACSDQVMKTNKWPWIDPLGWVCSDGMTLSHSGNVVIAKVKGEASNYFTGTGTEISRLLYYLSGGTRVETSINNIPGTNEKAQNLNNLAFVSSSGYSRGSTQLFGEALKVSTLTDVKAWGFTPITIAVNSSTYSKCSGVSGLKCVIDKSYGYALHLINIYANSTPPPSESCKTEADAKKLGRAWTGKYCCLPGQSYNKSTDSCFSHQKSSSDNYYYTCNADISVCKDGGLSSTIKSFYGGGGTHGNSTVGVSNGECIFNNMKYMEATNLYCSDTVDTDFSSIINVSSVKSGRFIPVNASNAKIKVTKKCYSTSSNIKTLVFNKFKRTYGPDIDITFLGHKVSLSSKLYNLPDANAVKLENGGKPRNTNYGKQYYEASVTLTYDYSASIYNQYVYIKSAKGSATSSSTNSSSRKTLSSSVNISVPMNKASGTYPVTYSFESISSTAIDHIFDGTFDGEVAYAYQKSSSCSGTCTVTFTDNNMSSKDCSDKKTEFDKVFKGGYSLDGNKKSWSNNTCTITYKFKTGTKDECTKSKGSQSGMTTSYVQSTACDDFVIFDNKSNAPSSNSFSCKKNITITNENLYEKLVFRPIDLSNPFPGKSGSGRDSGTNWSKDEIKKYITDRQNVYSKKPLYSVTLTSSDIKDIRKYNDSHGYDDFTLSCKDSGASACYSSFIRKYLTENKSNCYNKNSQTTASFDSCAVRS